MDFRRRILGWRRSGASSKWPGHFRPDHRFRGSRRIECRRGLRRDHRHWRSGLCMARLPAEGPEGTGRRGPPCLRGGARDRTATGEKQGGATRRGRMTLVRSLRRHWQEAALTLVLALPWMALLMLGIVWLWQGGHVLA